MFARHSLIWLFDQGWQRVLDAAPESDHAAIDTWRQAGWPAVVRRADADASEHQICFGLALPPRPIDGLKVRIALRAPVEDVKQKLPPLCIEAAIGAAPEAWRSALAALDAEAMHRGLSIRIYGSVALQALTGQTYVTAASDIDLLFYPRSAVQLRTGIDLLARHANGLPLDGEIVFPSGQAVAWKEWMVAKDAPNNPHVLVKENCAVHLLPAAALLATFQDASCMI
jgi:phosphoribosyl-dephospho-CoA transferase